MRVVKPGEKVSKEDLKLFARTAAEAYVNDPVHSYATKHENLRKKFIYHFMMERLNTSNGEDYFYIDDENRGVCVWRKAHNEYTVLDFFRCSHWLYLWLCWPNTIKTLMAYSDLDVKKFDDKTWIISPVFVSPEHQEKGIATELIKKSIEDLSKEGYHFGLEAQDMKNVRFYEKLGFKVFDKNYFKQGNITHYYMIYDAQNSIR